MRCQQKKSKPLSVGSLTKPGISVARLTFEGTQTGQPPTGMTPAGKHVIFALCFISHWMDGKIVEEWSYLDHLGLLQQLGFKLAPPSEEGED